MKSPIVTSAVESAPPAPGEMLMLTNAVSGAPQSVEAAGSNASSATNSQSPAPTDFFQSAESVGAEIRPGTSDGRSGLP